MKKNGHFLPDRGAVVLSGLLGCLCFGAGDWLMIWGNPAAEGRLSWLTLGTAQIPQWRYSLAMALAFPGILFYGAALFSMGRFIRKAHEKKVYGIFSAKTLQYIREKRD